jgi:hypothetical protein
VLAWSPLIAACLMAVICGAAVFIGQWEERVVGALYGAAWLLSLAAASRVWQQPQWAVMAIDVAILLALIAVISWSTKIWPILAGSMQLLTVGAHIAFILGRTHLGADAYLTVLGLWSYGILICIGCGALRVRIAGRRDALRRRVEAETRWLVAEAGDLDSAWAIAREAAEHHVVDRRAHAFYRAIATHVGRLAGR